MIWVTSLRDRERRGPVDQVSRAGSQGFKRVDGSGIEPVELDWFEVCFHHEPSEFTAVDGGFCIRSCSWDQSEAISRNNSQPHLVGQKWGHHVELPGVKTGLEQYVRHVAELTELTLDAAVQLLHPFQAAVARESVSRTIVIKGLAHDAHHIRPPRVPADIDVLVDPGRFDGVLDRFEALGWSVRPGSSISKAPDAHSVALHHPEWPADIDLHRTFPGFLAKPATVFEALWANRSALEVAGHPCDGVGLEGAVLISALHSLRDLVGVRRHGDELQYLLSRVIPRLTPTQRETLVALARRTGSFPTLQPVLADLFAGDRGVGSTADSAALDAWQQRISQGSTRTGTWLDMLRDQSIRSWPRTFAAAVWPNESEIRADHSSLPAGVQAVNKYRRERLLRGVRSLPAVVSARIPGIPERRLQRRLRKIQRRQIDHLTRPASPTTQPRARIVEVSDAVTEPARAIGGVQEASGRVRCIAELAVVQQPSHVTALQLRNLNTARPVVFANQSLDVWQRLQAPTTIEAIAADIATGSGDMSEDIVAVVEPYVEQLIGLGLVERMG